jgi:ribose transport system ATP-binding protein
MLELRNISKSFPGVQALDDVSVSFRPGEIHALVGENGAGKSTLMKIITGIYQPDAGSVIHDGARLHFDSYSDSLKAGIDIVHQEIQVVPECTVAESIMIDKLITIPGTGIVRWDKVNEAAARYMQMVELDIPPDTLVKSLSAAQKRLTQIARALAADARVILLDEPTGALTEHEAQNLFRILRDLKARGVTMVFVSHKFEEVFALCDRATVLRDGRFVDTRVIAELDPNDLIAMMIGREFTETHLGRVNVNHERVVLEAKGLTRRGKIREASFVLHEGEILGFYGLVGAGRTELARVIIGEERTDAGTLWVRGKPARIRSIADSLYRYGIGYVTENRKEEGLFLEDTVRSNISVAIWPRLRHALTRRIDPRAEDAVCRETVASMSIKTPGLNQTVGHLSGGNQQKISVGKWLAADCDVLIIDEPTIGVDVGAKDQIHHLVRELAETQRKAVILISSDMPEVIKLSNRILVFRGGSIVGEVDDVDNPERGYRDISREIGEFLR